MISDNFVYLVNTFMLQHKANLLNLTHGIYFIGVFQHTKL